MFHYKYHIYDPKMHFIFFNVTYITPKLRPCDICHIRLFFEYNYFTINENLFNSMLIFSATMLGVSTVKAFAKKSENESKQD